MGFEPGVSIRVAVPEGFSFDGASIPRWAWSVIGPPFEPDFVQAACVHDWICTQSLAFGDYQARVTGDSLFFGLLAGNGVSRWKRTAMYLAVRVHSWWNYGRNTPSVGLAVDSALNPSTRPSDGEYREDWA